MRELRTVVLLIFALLAGCSSAPKVATPVPPPALSPPKWEYEKNGVHLHLKADPHLNLFNKTPHTLMLCIYHLRDLNSFVQLQDERDGLQKLLECNRFDPSVLYARRMVIQPGQEILESVDRMEGARFINFAAGYYKMEKGRVIRSYPVPVREEVRGGTLVQLPQQLVIDLHLGPEEIQEVQPTPQVQKK